MSASTNNTMTTHTVTTYENKVTTYNDYDENLYCDPHCTEITQFHSIEKIRLSIFLIIGVCVGLPALVWALRVLYRRHKSGGRISVLVLILLLCDLLEILLSPCIVTKLFQDAICRWRMACWVFSSLMSVLLFYGFLLHQVVALEHVLSFRHPHCAAHVFFPSCSVIVCIIVFIGYIICELLGVRIVFVVLSSPLLLVMSLIMCILTCRAPPHTDTPYTTRKPSYTVVGFVMFTMTLYMTFLIVFLSTWRFRDQWELVVTLLSLRRITDPVLCVLIYRKDLSYQTRSVPPDIELTQTQSSNDFQ